MKKLAILLASMAFIAAASDGAYAAEKNAHGLYMAVRAGFGISQVDELDFDLGDASYTLDAEEDSDTSSLFGLTIGWDFSRTSGDPIRLEFEFMSMGEAEVTWRDDVVVAGQSYDERFGGEISVTTLMLNGYYDFHNASRFTPFVQAGLGIANVKLDVSWNDNGFDMGSESETNTNLAVGAGAGVGFGITDNLSFDAAYRFNYLGPAGVEANGVDVQVESTLWRHDILLGVRYTF